MLTASSGVAGAVVSPAQSIVTDVQVDLARTGSYTDISDYISTWSFSRDLTTDVPQNARLVTGYAAAELNLTGKGNTANNAQNGAWYWSPYNQDPGAALSGATARIGTPFVVHAGFKTTAGNEVLPRFTGTLRSVDVDGAQGTAALDVLDGSDKIRAQCNIPMILGDYVATGYSNGAVRQGLNGGRVIDYLLRANGFYSTPPPRTGCLVSVPGHGSLEPDYVVNASSGTYTQYGSTKYAYDGPYSTAAQSAPGGSVVQYITDMGLDSRTGKPKAKFGQCPDPIQGIAASWVPATTPSMSSGSTLTVEGWIDVSNPLGVASGSRLITIGLTSTPPGSGVQPLQTIEVGFMGDSRPFICVPNTAQVIGTGSVASGSRGWIYCLINVQISANSQTATAAFTLNSTAPTTGNGRVISTSCNFGNPNTFTSVGLYGDLTIPQGCMARFEGLQVTTEASGAAIAATNVFFTPSAFIEPSLNKLTAVPFSDATQDSWQTLQDITAAEFGVLFFDELGVATFWNRNHITAQASAVATVTTARQLTALTTSESVDSVKNHIVATITPYQVQAASYIYNLGKTIGVHSQSTFNYIATFDNPAVAINLPLNYIELGDSSTTSGYRACRTPDGTGAPVRNVQITITPYAQSAKVSIFNPNNYPVYLVCPLNDESGNAYPTTSAALPFLRLWGQNVIQSLSPTTTASGSDVATTATLEAKDPTSYSLYGQQEYDLPASGWLQDADDVQTIITDLLGQLCRPFPLFTNVVIVADPRLQLGDRIRLQDPTGTRLDNDAYVVGIDESLDPTQGYTQSLTLRAIGGPNAWTLGDAVKGKLDSVYVLGGLF